MLFHFDRYFGGFFDRSFWLVDIVTVAILAIFSGDIASDDDDDDVHRAGVDNVSKASDFFNKLDGFHKSISGDDGDDDDI